MAYVHLYHQKLQLHQIHIEDYRNYKVSINRIMDVLSFKPINNIDSIVKELAENFERFKDFQNDNYFNIKVFSKLFPQK